MKSCFFTEQHRCPLRGTKWNPHLSAPRNALQDAGAAAPLCDRSDGLGGFVGQQRMHADPAFQDFPTGSKARRGILLRSRDSRSFAITACLCERQLRAAPRTQWRPCPALAGDVHCNCVLTPGNMEPTASSQLHPSQLPAQGSAPRVLLLPPQGKPCPLNLCLFFFFSSWGLGWFLAKEKKSQRIHVSSIL